MADDIAYASLLALETGSNVTVLEVKTGAIHSQMPKSMN